MFRTLQTRFTQVIRQAFPPARINQANTFIDEPSLGVKRRHYATYEDYLRHQSEKLGKTWETIVQSDKEYEVLVTNRYRQLFGFNGKSILCLGARLGGEVRAFKALGALAIGIDIEPGPDNCHVLHGDFHKLLFPDECFDFVFTNVVDHVLYLDRFVFEAARVLKAEGNFLVEFVQIKPGRYEVLDTSDLEPIQRPFLKSFEIVAQEPINNKTEYINWNGQLVQFRKLVTNSNDKWI